MHLLRSSSALLAGAALLVAGCGPKSPPKIVPVEGTVYLDDKPLPFARLDFIPMLEDFGAEMNSSAVTDENGRYSLSCAYKSQPGAAVASHRVLVGEHTPDELRGSSAETQFKMAQYLAKLKNRPIPDAFSNFIKGLVTVEVKAGQAEYDLRLTRAQAQQ